MIGRCTPNHTLKLLESKQHSSYILEGKGHIPYHFLVGITSKSLTTKVGFESKNLNKTPPIFWQTVSVCQQFNLLTLSYNG